MVSMKILHTDDADRGIRADDYKNPRRAALIRGIRVLCSPIVSSAK